MYFMTGVTCPQPPKMAHSTINIGGQKYQDELNYTCQTGYFINGTITLFQSSCTADKTWQPQPLGTCLRKL